jgi:hypothetical protein
MIYDPEILFIELRFRRTLDIVDIEACFTLSSDVYPTMLNWKIDRKTSYVFTPQNWLVILV